MTNIQFFLIDSAKNPLVGSKVTLKPFSAPYISGSVISSAIPVSLYTDNTGTVTFPNVIAGTYKVSVSPAGATNTGSLKNTLQNFANEVFYISVAPNAGTINGANCLVTQPSNTGVTFTGSMSNSDFFALTISASDARYVLKGGSIDNAISSSYAQTASWAQNVVGGSGNSTSASWASSSLSASYLKNTTVTIDTNGVNVNDPNNSYNVTIAPSNIVVVSSDNITNTITLDATSSSITFTNDSSPGATISTDSSDNIFLNTLVSVNKTGGITGSLQGTASYAQTASYITSINIVGSITAFSSSWASSSLSASIAATASYITSNNIMGTITALSASWASSSLSASYITSSGIVGAITAFSSSYASVSNIALTATSASYSPQVWVTDPLSNINYSFGSVGIGTALPSTSSVSTVGVGTNWTTASVPNASWTDIAYGNGRFVAISSNGSAMYSVDGKNWITSSVPTGMWSSVCYGNGLFVSMLGIGSTSTTGIMTSPDGITWTLRNTGQYKFINNTPNAICYGNGKFVAVNISNVSNYDNLF